MRPARRRRQRGAALMVMLAVIVLGASWWLVTALGTPLVRAPLEADHNARVLSQAKAALLGWVAQRALMAAENHPGRLPCPESPNAANNYVAGNYVVDDDGVMAPSCTLPAVGRFPWRSMGIDKLTDAAGEPLWYVVSPGWADPSPAADPVINPNTAAQLTLDGRAVVALIIAPGRPLNVEASAGCAARQQSRARQQNVAWDLRDFLECDNATSPANTSFVSNGPAGSFNDQVIALTAKDVWTHVEGPVAARIQRDIAPQFNLVYNKAPAACAGGVPTTQTNEWGVSFNCPAGTPTNPVFPFAATFGDPAAASFKGVMDLREGLLPLTASSCAGLGIGHCDAAFIRWKTTGITATRAGGNANTGSPVGNCAASTTSEIVCDFTYGKLLCTSAVIGPCTVSGGTATFTMTVQNVLMALRQHASPLPVVNASAPTMTTTLITGVANPDRGGALVTVTAELPTASGCSISIGPVLGLYVCTGLIGMSTTQTVRIPITVFADHPLLNPASGDAAYWYMYNKWYDVTYYAVAPKHVVTGARNCDPAGATDAACLNVTVQGGATQTNRRALVALAGRSLNGTAGSNRALGDFLDAAENTDLDTDFVQNRPNQSTFNDRFVSISP